MSNTDNKAARIQAAANAWYDNYIATNVPHPFLTKDGFIEAYRVMFTEQLMGSITHEEVCEVIDENWVELGPDYRDVQSYLYTMADEVSIARAAKAAKLAAKAAEV